VVKRVREDWIEVARETLVKGGVEAVTVQSISRKLGVTRGGFYGYFGSRSALLERLLQDWREVNTRALRTIADRNRTDGSAQFEELVNMWIEDADYSPQYDSAVRDWARRSPHVARAVLKVDHERIRLIERIFNNIGFRGFEANVRSRVTYYHQVGYYALAEHESRPTRRRLSAMYTRILAGPRGSLPPRTPASSNHRRADERATGISKNER
jgi:AcrR family transcriptional regulator